MRAQVTCRFAAPAKPFARISDAATDALTNRQRSVLETIPDEWTALPALLVSAKTTRPTLAKLAAAGVVEMEERFLDELAASAEDLAAEADLAAAAADALPAPVPAFALTAAQQAAVAECRAASGS